MDEILSNSSMTCTELSLHGQIPSSRHEQLLQILAGLTAMPPQRVLERHIIYKPTRGPVQRAAQVGGSQGIQDAQKTAAQKAQAGNTDLWYLRLVEEGLEGSNDVNTGKKYGQEGDEERMEDVEGSSDAEKPLASRARWSLRFYDLPEAGKRPVTARTVSTEAIVSGDALGFMSGLGYSFVSEHILEGHRFVHNNVVLLLHRIMRHLPSINGSTNSVSQQPRKPLETAPPLSSLAAIDDSGAYVLQATVRLQDGRQPESSSRGTQELLRFKERMKGIIDLRVVDRLALDTRVK